MQSSYCLDRASQVVMLCHATLLLVNTIIIIFFFLVLMTKYKQSGFDKDGVIDMLNIRNAMPKYDNYEYNLSLRKKHALDPYDHGLSDDYFDQHALSVDRRFRVKKMSKILPKIKWNKK